jgi:hypothetical protein
MFLDVPAPQPHRSREVVIALIVLSTLVTMSLSSTPLRALVVGGTSGIGHGIGHGIALALAKRGDTMPTKVKRSRENKEAPCRHK